MLADYRAEYGRGDSVGKQPVGSEILVLLCPYPLAANMYFQQSEPSALGLHGKHKIDFVHWWINNTIKSRYISKVSLLLAHLQRAKSAYCAPSIESEMATSSASSMSRRRSSTISRRSSTVKSQLKKSAQAAVHPPKKVKKTLSTRSSAYSSQSSVAHTSEPIDIDAIDAIAMSSDDEENVDIDLEQELGTLRCFFLLPSDDGFYFRGSQEDMALADLFLLQI